MENYCWIHAEYFNCPRIIPSTYANFPYRQHLRNQVFDKTRPLFLSSDERAIILFTCWANGHDHRHSNKVIQTIQESFISNETRPSNVGIYSDIIDCSEY